MRCEGNRLSRRSMLTVGAVGGLGLSLENYFAMKQAKAEYAMGYFTEVGIGAPVNVEEVREVCPCCLPFWRRNSCMERFGAVKPQLRDPIVWWVCSGRIGDRVCLDILSQAREFRCERSVGLPPVAEKRVSAQIRSPPEQHDLLNHPHPPGTARRAAVATLLTLSHPNPTRECCQR